MHMRNEWDPISAHLLQDFIISVFIGTNRTELNKEGTPQQKQEKPKLRRRDPLKPFWKDAVAFFQWYQIPAQIGCFFGALSIEVRFSSIY